MVPLLAVVEVVVLVEEEHVLVGVDGMVCTGVDGVLVDATRGTEEEVGDATPAAEVDVGRYCKVGKKADAGTWMVTIGSFGREVFALLVPLPFIYTKGPWCGIIITLPVALFPEVIFFELLLLVLLALALLALVVLYRLFTMLLFWLLWLWLLFNSLVLLSLSMATDNSRIAAPIPESGFFVRLRGRGRVLFIANGTDEGSGAPAGDTKVC